VMNITILSQTPWLMLFRMQGESFLCLEPQSHPVNAHNMDGQPGLNIPDSRERRAVKEALADIGQQTGTSIDISRNAGQQVLADISRTALRATTRYAAEKLKEVKITLKADHRIYLLSKE
jgi:hypothetical protein